MGEPPVPGARPAEMGCGLGICASHRCVSQSCRGAPRWAGGKIYPCPAAFSLACSGVLLLRMLTLVRILELWPQFLGNVTVNHGDTYLYVCL